MLDVLLFAFSAGLAAAFNPCGIAMFPAYVGYQLGTLDLKQGLVQGVIFSLALGLSATMGFVTLFGSVGLVMAAGFSIFSKSLPIIGLGIGIIILLLGIWMLLSGKNLELISASRVNLGQGRGLVNTFLFGIAYAVASLSCALPLFLVGAGIVVGKSLSTGDFLGVIAGSVSYGVGMGVVMVSASVGILFFKDAVNRWINTLMKFVEPLGKVAMVIAGTYLIYYWTIGNGKELLLTRISEF